LPRLSGFGFSDAPDRTQFQYTFEHLTEVMDGFTETVGLKRYAMYIFDYGAPVGSAVGAGASGARHRHHLANGSAYEEGLSVGLQVA
jgi:hypothetical protein